MFSDKYERSHVYHELKQMENVKKSLITKPKKPPWMPRKTLFELVNHSLSRLTQPVWNIWLLVGHIKRCLREKIEFQRKRTVAKQILSNGSIKSDQFALTVAIIIHVNLFGKL
ncbi:uncharacterized protein LOC113003800 [Solenopsis invicta]|uniref:uncharacterized protein LOC113003800 n=1 Tax=Solenopsis invicta TaxID=13686 RepID=UPI000E33D532|nr:uncharacterized protein LOC113003800 [Solenopsis invicta]